MSELNFKSNEVSSIIIETRKHPALYFVINQFIKLTNIPVQLFCGRNNYKFIISSKIKDLVKKKLVSIIPLNADTLCANKYNALMLTKKFWDHIYPSKKIIIFQTWNLYQ